MPVSTDGSQEARETALLGWRAAIAFHRRIFRLAVHDLSNPLAAARLLAELARRGASSDDDVNALLEQLGIAAERLQGLRVLLREAGPENVELGAVLELAAALIARETERVGARLMVDRAEDLVAMVPRHLLLQVVLAGLLTSLEGAADGDVLILRSRREPGERLLVELESSGRGERPCRPEERLCLDLLAQDLGGIFEVEPGTRPAHDPDWRLVLSPAA